MTELYEKSLRKLELDNVLAQLADCANSEDGKDRCRALLPLDDAEEIRLLQQQTTAACGMIVRKGAPGFHELKPVAASLERADRGGCLTPVELLRIAGVLRCIRNVKAYYSEDGEPTVLDVYFQELSPNRYLEEKITNSILSEEEIADAASSELADIRRHMRIQSAKVKDSLQKIISSPSFSKYLRDPIITLRGDRYVVPVKSEYKSEIPGLVHDVSSTGSTFFIEPMSAVNANNALRELLIREKKEIERILAALRASATAMRCSCSSTASLPARACRTRWTAWSRRSARTPVWNSCGRAIRSSTARRSFPSRCGSARISTRSSSPARTPAARPLRSRPSAF